MSRTTHIPVLDEKQRYPINEAALLLRQSRAKCYSDIRAGRLAVFKDGRRTYVPGREIVRRSRGDGQPQSVAVPVTLVHRRADNHEDQGDDEHAGDGRRRARGIAHPVAGPLPNDRDQEMVLAVEMAKELRS